MNISRIINTHLLERAYHLWKTADSQEPFDATQRRIITDLFNEIRALNPWMSWFYTLIEYFNPFWMQIKVDAAFNAYKFDLFISGKADQKLHLFSEKEKWFITDQKISSIFKNLLNKKQFLTINQRGCRWKQKVNKYWENKEYMIVIYLLFVISKKFPNIKNSIDWVKLLNLGLLKKKSIESFEDLNDDAVARGLTAFAGIPFDERKGVFRLFAELSYCVTLEEAKLCLTTFWSQVKDRTQHTWTAASKVFSKSA